MSDASIYDDWSAIPAAASGKTTLSRVDAGHPLDFWRGRDEEGRYLFCLQPLREVMAKLPELTGIRATCPQLDDSHSSLRLTLVDHADIAIFSALTRDLLGATRGFATEDNDRGAIAVLGRLRQWQEMLERSRTTSLSRSQIIGLVGELCFLRDVLAPLLGWERAVSGWVGGFGDEQDFAVGNLIVETKTQATTRDAALKISSEHQLDTGSGPICIRHLTLAPGSTPSPPGFATLNETVAELRAAVAKVSLAAADQLETALLAWGYRALPEYDREAWQPVVARNFEVTADFPRIIASEVAEGVSRVRYKVAMGSVVSFQRDEEWLAGLISGAETHV